MKFTGFSCDAYVLDDPSGAGDYAVAAAPTMARLAVRTHRGAELLVHLTRFDLERFDALEFGRSGIVCPSVVARSVHKRQAEFFFGRLMARQALEALGVDAGEIGIGASREPMWPDGVVGSISHTHAVAGAVVSRREACSGVGIDIEHIAGAEACDALSATVVSAAERQYLETLAEILPMDVALTAVFSAKESLFKAAFGEVGRYFDFSAARVIGIEAERGVIRLELTETLCSAFARDDVCEIGFCFIAPSIILTHFTW